MNNIRSYIILNKKTNTIIKLFIIISIIIIVSLFVTMQLKYKKYYQTYARVLEDGKVMAYLNPCQLQTLRKRKSILIEGVSYNFKINYIDSEYTLSNECNNCTMVVLDINLKTEDKIINNILNIEVLENDKKMIYYVKDYFMKGECK